VVTEVVKCRERDLGGWYRSGVWKVESGEEKGPGVEGGGYGWSETGIYIVR
jgi:hypothetical protein